MNSTTKTFLFTIVCLITLGVTCSCNNELEPTTSQAKPVDIHVTRTRLPSDWRSDSTYNQRTRLDIMMKNLAALENCPVRIGWVTSNEQDVSKHCLVYQKNVSENSDMIVGQAYVSNPLYDDDIFYIHLQTNLYSDNIMLNPANNPMITITNEWNKYVYAQCMNESRYKKEYNKKDNSAVVELGSVLKEGSLDSFTPACLNAHEWELIMQTEEGDALLSNHKYGFSDNRNLDDYSYRNYICRRPSSLSNCEIPMLNANGGYMDTPLSNNSEVLARTLLRIQPVEEFDSITVLYDLGHATSLLQFTKTIPINIKNEGQSTINDYYTISLDPYEDYCFTTSFSGLNLILNNSIRKTPLPYIRLIATYNQYGNLEVLPTIQPVKEKNVDGQKKIDCINYQYGSLHFNTPNTITHSYTLEKGATLSKNHIVLVYHVDVPCILTVCKKTNPNMKIQIFATWQAHIALEAPDTI